MSDHGPLAPFFTPAAKETHVQKVLRKALEYVQAHGAQGWVEAGPPGRCRLVTICGFPVQEKEPDKLTLIAARLLIREMFRGLYDLDGVEEEYECLGWDYAEVVQSLDIYVDAVGMTDAYICAVLEKAYERVALPPPLADREPLTWAN